MPDARRQQDGIQIAVSPTFSYTIVPPINDREQILADALAAAEERARRLEAIAQRLIDAYPGNQAGRLGNGAARRALDEFRAALADEESG